MRTLEIMNSNASSDIQGIVTDLLNSRPYSHRQDADSSVAAVITAQSDLRFFSSTFAAVLAQRVLPGTIIVADCTNQVEQPMQMTFSVIPSPAGVLTEVPESKTIRVILVGVKGASSFMNAVARAMQQIDLDDRVGALWTLHDDSRPADESCLEVFLDAWKNTPTASLLGAKQLDWQAESLHNVGVYAGHHNVTSLVVDGVGCVAFRRAGSIGHLAYLEGCRSMVRHVRRIHGPVQAHLPGRWPCGGGPAGANRP